VACLSPLRMVCHYLNLPPPRKSTVAPFLSLKTIVAYLVMQALTQSLKAKLNLSLSTVNFLTKKSALEQA
jgi:hypothetical protein